MIFLFNIINMVKQIRPDTSVADSDHFYTDPALFSTLIRIRIQLFDTDPDPYHFKEVM
jgi:hypothetical protein